jgi:hypothetical protein
LLVLLRANSTMRRSAALVACCCTATTLEEQPWLRRELRPEDESISKKKAGQKGVAGGPCYPGKTECPFSTSCEWDRDTEDGEEFRERICVHKDLVPANGRASVHESHHDFHAIDAT